ncbi:hypothetical protein EGM97_21750 [Pseudomonas sp. AF32]|uniref:hypothetical protein n=1 Tax=Pseudomonas sp. AF32 TaxID=554390 RepID=UPI001EEE07A8|nr:hypothetical protein [Pseudomonas sp. AF32]MCG6577326.1 hypothetical protein [Pseudomonas sp. AF32]
MRKHNQRFLGGAALAFGLDRLPHLLLQGFNGRSADRRRLLTMLGGIPVMLDPQLPRAALSR